MSSLDSYLIWRVFLFSSSVNLFAIFFNRKFFFHMESKLIPLFECYSLWIISVIVILRCTFNKWKNKVYAPAIEISYSIMHDPFYLYCVAKEFRELLFFKDYRYSGSDKGSFIFYPPIHTLLPATHERLFILNLNSERLQDHSFSTYGKFTEKLTFLTCYTHVYACV